MFLIKENHIAAAGSITKAVSLSQQIAPEAEIEEFNEAAASIADYIMLDEFEDDQIDVVIKSDPRAAAHELEISGGLDLSKVGEHHFERKVRASVGVMTKEVKVVDLSLRIF